ncbi:MAG: hypothetical protein CM1200mP20_09370 [Pseudomonadota bacterium]|nr:MAG: hypothetical protein CM1200mP20_09370 [Pseudomonadota bacterium]
MPAIDKNSTTGVQLSPAIKGTEQNTFFGHITSFPRGLEKGHGPGEMAFSSSSIATAGEPMSKLLLKGIQDKTPKERPLSDDCLVCGTGMTGIGGFVLGLTGVKRATQKSQCLQPMQHAY